MNKETHDILITLVLPRYEVMSIIGALRRWTDIEDRKGYSSSNIKALADKIFAITREQFVAFEQKQSDHIPLSQRNPYE